MHRVYGRSVDTGFYTVEGTEARSRAAGLTQQRAADQEVYEAIEQWIVGDSGATSRAEGDPRTALVRRVNCIQYRC